MHEFTRISARRKCARIDRLASAAEKILALEARREAEYSQADPAYQAEQAALFRESVEFGPGKPMPPVDVAAVKARVKVVMAANKKRDAFVAKLRASAATMGRVRAAPRHPRRTARAPRRTRRASRVRATRAGPKSDGPPAPTPEIAPLVAGGSK